MPTLLFTVSPAGAARVHDILICLAKFDEDVTVEATPQFVGPKVCLSHSIQYSLMAQAAGLESEHIKDCSRFIRTQFGLL